MVTLPHPTFLRSKQGGHKRKVKRAPPTNDPQGWPLCRNPSEPYLQAGGQCFWSPRTVGIEGSQSIGGAAPPTGPQKGDEGIGLHQRRESPAFMKLIRPIIGCSPVNRVLRNVSGLRRWAFRGLAPSKLCFDGSSAKRIGEWFFIPSTPHLVFHHGL